ncbi:carbohydrate esterase family 15 protein [Staphylotrichum tortipilum]|uniref:(4-O-methyl)-D-glucuronate--lignin esterase n=1 Tax=Staphylotrichum tortipilum TaxID=2831512 RepID=A0AAN6MDX1_9PEZI|nr:carbohydrate esterase family 15 protein [Staphylotrichum longicolle]
MKPSAVFLGIAALAGQHALAQEQSPLPASCSTFPTQGQYPKNAKLPDPFLKADGTRPGKPTVTTSMSGSTISITCAEGGKTISFSVAVKAPSGSGQAPYPAVIGLGGGSVPYPAGVAVISYNNQDIAVDNPHGKGKFYDLYGSTHAAGGLMAWAWGVSRVVDALEQLGADKTKIDVSRLGVTGCSRNGKGALVAGAFDDRIALVLPQEAGSGGPGCWRIVNDMKKNGTKVEDSTQIVQGDGWFTPSFVSTAADVSVLPFDHHMLIGLVAPRGLLVVENSGIDYLGPPSTFGCTTAAREIYAALGVGDRIGISQASHGSSHCQLPSSQNGDVAAYFGRFLLNATAGSTGFMDTDAKWVFSLPQWADWTLAALS